jgi:hypothetical protein
MARDTLIPNPLNSDREYNRYYHHDLAGIETGDLLCELCSTRCQLWLLKSDRFARVLGLFEQGRRVEWLRERILRIEVELRRRRYAIWEVRSQPKPKLAEGVRL